MDAEIIESCIGNDGTGARHVAGISQALRTTGNASLAVGLDVPHTPAAQLGMRRASDSNADQGRRLRQMQPHIACKSGFRFPSRKPRIRECPAYVTDITDSTFKSVEISASGKYPLRRRTHSLCQPRLSFLLSNI